MKSLIQKWLGIKPSNKTYLLIHIFDSGKFIGQYTQEVEGSYEIVSGTIARLDPRTQRNIDLWHILEPTKGKLQTNRPTLTQGYTDNTELRVVQVFCV